MVTILTDNTKNLLYTKCKTCRSELNYRFNDVEIVEVPFSQVPNRFITCPACKDVTFVELMTKDNYNESAFGFAYKPELMNSCISGKDND